MTVIDIRGKTRQTQIGKVTEGETESLTQSVDREVLLLLLLLLLVLLGFDRG